MAKNECNERETARKRETGKTQQVLRTLSQSEWACIRACAEGEETVVMYHITHAAHLNGTGVVRKNNSYSSSISHVHS